MGGDLWEPLGIQTMSIGTVEDCYFWSPGLLRRASKVHEGSNHDLHCTSFTVTFVSWLLLRVLLLVVVLYSTVLVQY